jgi:hypothetical protein
MALVMRRGISAINRSRFRNSGTSFSLVVVFNVLSHQILVGNKIIFPFASSPLSPKSQQTFSDSILMCSSVRNDTEQYS